MLRVKEKQMELKQMRPKYDIGYGRMAYPTEMADGEIAYLARANAAIAPLAVVNKPM